MRVALACLCIVSCAKSLPPGATPPNTAPAPEASAQAAPAQPSWPGPIAYPEARRGDVADRMHDRTVPDPYRWLEDLSAPEVQSWSAAQDQLTQTTLSRLPAQAALRGRMSELVRVLSFGVPVQRKHTVFWRQSDGSQEQPQLVFATAPDAEATTLLDYNQVATDGKWSPAGFTPSQDGSRIAYGLAAGGGDWQTWRVRDVATRSDLPDELSGIKYYRPVFAADGKSLYYSRFPAPLPGKELVARDEHCKVYQHRLGTPVSSDVVIYERPDHPTWQFRPLLTPDGRYLLVTIGDGEVGDRGQEQLVYFDLHKAAKKPLALIDQYDASYLFIGNEGPVFYLLTTLDADNKRIIAIDTRSPARAHWKEVISAGKDAIDEAALIGHQLLVTTLRDAHSVLSAYDVNGKLVREAELPGLGTVFGLSGGPDDTQTYYTYTSFTEPRTLYRYDLASGTSTRWKNPGVAFDPSAFETRQVFYLSADGQKIPMFIVGQREAFATAPMKPRPTILSGYGGGGVPNPPWFQSDTIAWLERGGLYAVANVRGGGEYGESWHRAAMGANKHVSVDDFRAGAQWLIDNHYTTARQLGATGTSGGGLLVGAAVVKQPELFGAVVPIAGVFDLLRMGLFGEGAGWETDAGSASNPAEFPAVLALSPLHAIRAQTAYPPLLIITSDSDVRVAPLHSFKFAASLQAAQSSTAPVLLRVWKNTGHGMGASLSQRVDQNAEVLSFFANALALDATP